MQAGFVIDKSPEKKGEERMSRFVGDRVRGILGAVLVPAALLLFPFSTGADSQQLKAPERTSSKSGSEALSIVKRMKEVIEPRAPSLHRIVMTVKSPSAYRKGSETAEKVAGMAVKDFPDGKRMLIVMLAPEDVRGMAFLTQEREDRPDVMWTYVPAIRRVREVKAIGQYENFLGTDFTYADLGFVELHDYYHLLGEEERNGVRTYEIEEQVPQEWMYYSKVITWVAADTMLPTERDYYDPAGDLLKTEAFQAVSVVEGVPTALRILMKEVQQDTSTELSIRAVDYDKALPDRLFDPARLPLVLNEDIWKSCSP